MAAAKEVVGATPLFFSAAAIDDAPWRKPLTAISPLHGPLGNVHDSASSQVNLESFQTPNAELAAALGSNAPVHYRLSDYALVRFVDHGVPPFINSSNVRTETVVDFVRLVARFYELGLVETQATARRDEVDGTRFCTEVQAVRELIGRLPATQESADAVYRLLHVAGSALPFTPESVVLAGKSLLSFPRPSLEQPPVDLAHTARAVAKLGKDARPAPLGSEDLPLGLRSDEKLFRERRFMHASDAALQRYVSRDNRTAPAGTVAHSKAKVDFVEYFAKGHATAGTGMLRWAARLLELGVGERGIMLASGGIFLSSRLPKEYTDPACWPDLVRFAAAVGLPVEAIEVQTASGAVGLTSLPGFPA
jgi:hypothetical protein